MKKVKLKAVRKHPPFGQDVTDEQLLEQILDLEDRLESVAESGGYPLLGYQVLASLKQKYSDSAFRKRAGLNCENTATSEKYNPLTGRPLKRHRYTSLDTAPSPLGWAMFYYYLYKATKNLDYFITKETYVEKATHHGISPRKLWAWVKLMREQEQKPTEHHISIKEFAKQYRLILPMLKKVSLEAYDVVKLKLLKLINANPRLNLANPFT